MLSAGKALWAFIIFSFCSYFFFSMRGRGIELRDYARSIYYREKISNCCLIGRISLMQTNISAQRTELLLLPVAENHTLLDGSLMKISSGGKNGNFAEIAAGSLRKVMSGC